MTSLEHPNDAIINWIRSHKKLIYLTADLSIIILTLTSIHILRLTGWLTQNAWAAIFYISALTVVAKQLLRHRRSLLLAITFWVLLSIGCYTTLSWIWGGRFLAGWTSEQSLNFKELLSSTLTAVGGIGAVGYLVIKYREQASAERAEVHQNEGEADKKLTAAVQQLGSNSPQVRIAGVYALADVADTYEGPYHQRVVDILCGYLRTDRLLKDANGDTRYATNEDGSPNYSLPISADNPVESTILSVLASHLRSSTTAEAKHQSRGPWSICTLDIHGAHITEHVNFDYAQIGEIDAHGIQLTQGASFTQTKFTNRASFDNSTFTQIANFWKSKFENEVSFRGTTFKQVAFFAENSFKQEVDFSEASFTQEVNFRGTQFLRTTDFRHASFKEKTDFSAVSFTQTPRLFEAIFSKLITFEDATFMQTADFRNTTFKGRTIFINCTFQGKTKFTATTFHQDASFQNASFMLTTDFGGVSFIHSVNFSECTFKNAVEFTSSNFSGDAIFEDTTFMLDAEFTAASFANQPSFEKARFNFSLKGAHRIIFPEQVNLNNNSLPPGAEWSGSQI
jgi:hypothetical protein